MTSTKLKRYLQRSHLYAFTERSTIFCSDFASHSSRQGPVLTSFRSMMCRIRMLSFILLCWRGWTFSITNQQCCACRTMKTCTWMETTTLTVRVQSWSCWSAATPRKMHWVKLQRIFSARLMMSFTNGSNCATFLLLKTISSSFSTSSAMKAYWRAQNWSSSQSIPKEEVTMLTWWRAPNLSSMIDIQALHQCLKRKNSPFQSKGIQREAYPTRTSSTTLWRMRCL